MERAPFDGEAAGAPDGVIIAHSDGALKPLANQEIPVSCAPQQKASADVALGSVSGHDKANLRRLLYLPKADIG